MGKNQKKKPRSNRLEQTFEPRFLEASAADALELLEEVGDRGPALVDAWIAAGAAEAVHTVASSDTAPALARKTARRGINVLKSRGIAVPERKPAPPPAPASEQPTFEAWFYPPDQTGVSMYTFGSHMPGQRRDVADVRLHESAGVIEVRAGEATRSSIRESFKSMESQRGHAPTPVPLEWARWRVGRAKEMNASSGLIMPLGFDVAAPLLEPTPESEPTHPVDQANLEVDNSEPRVRESASLHNEPEFRGWLPEIQYVQELLGKVGERIGPDPDQDSERVNVIMTEELTAAVDRFFTPDVRERIASRMKDTAISVLARAGRDRTLDVLATAEAARQAGLITSPPSDVPFLKAFFQKALALIASSTGGKLSIPVPASQAEPQELTVAPPEALAAAAQSASSDGDATDP